MITNSCKKNDNNNNNQVPILTTSNVSNITQTTANSGGCITNDGGATVTARGVCWSTRINPTIADNKTYDSTGTVNFICIITGLTDSTTYYVRAYATNKIGTGYGSTISFTTHINSSLPILITSPVTNITITTANSGGTITSDGGTSITNKGVCWSTFQNPTINDAYTNDGFTSANFTSNITGLLNNTTYFVRAYAMNSTGIGYGNNESFITNGISFSTDVYPIFATYSCTDCHDDGNDLNLVGTASQVRINLLVAAVVPNSSASSLLYTKFHGATHKGKTLSNTEVTNIKVWIDAGALDN